MDSKEKLFNIKEEEEAWWEIHLSTSVPVSFPRCGMLQ